MNTARGIWPSLIVALLGFPIVLTLWQSVPNTNDFEIVPEQPSASRAAFVGLGQTPAADGTHTAQKAIWQTSPYSLLGHDEVRLLVVTYGAQLKLVRGEIRVPGTDCVYETAPGAALVNTALLAFRRAPACRQLQGDHSQLDLTISYRGEGRVGLATYLVPPSMTHQQWLTLTPADLTDPRPVAVVRGRYVDDLNGASMRRIELLARMWRVAESPVWIWSAVAAALLAVWLGAFFAAPAMPAAPAAPWWPTSIAVGAVALGLATLYSVLVPPLQAPDEPDHLLAFAQLAERPALAEQLATFAKQSHFERIHFRPDERFRPIDVNAPFAVAWNADVFAHVVSSRSATTAIWWRMLAPLVRDLDVGRVILALRLANGLLFALCLGLAAALLSWTSRSLGGAPHAVCLALLLIPTLPFFATHVSEFALLICAYVVAAAAITALFLDGDRVHWLGFPLGVAAACILAGGRSGLPFAATLAAVVAGRALIGSPNADAGRDVRRALVFWTGLAVGLALFPLLSTPEFRDGLWPADSGQLPPWFRSAAELIRFNPGMVAVLIPTGFAIELASTRLRRWLPGPGQWAKGVVTVVCAAAAVAVMGSVVVSAVLPYPTLIAREIAVPPSAGAYAREVLTVAATGFRVANHDWLLSSSFWTGFGWLETAPGEGLVTLLVLLTAVALAALCVHLARTTATRRAMWLGILGTGWLVTLVLYAVSSYFLQRNLHGRYLVGLNLSFLAVSWSVLALPWWRTAQATPSVDNINRVSALLLAAVAIHSYALRFILLRYL